MIIKCVKSQLNVAGLTLTLFKQDLKYLNNYTSGSGFGVAVYPYITELFPYEAGISIMSGQETFLAMDYVWTFCLFNYRINFEPQQSKK